MSTSDNWRSGGDPTTRGRGGGRGTGRPSSRGGRTRTGQPPNANNATPSERKPAATVAAHIPASSTGIDSAAARPKPSRRSSKPVPVPNVDVSPSTPSSSEPAAGRPPNRRRRSQAHGRSTTTNTTSTGSTAAASRAKKGPVPPAIDVPLLNPQSDHVRPGPQTAPLSKDIPPHLVVRNTEIDALVEKVRASAIVRPSTPGSHIDWAGDEDDSLPDLDDWVVKPATNGDGETEGGTKKSELISPIMVDGLRPLPEPMIGRLSPSPTPQPMPMPPRPQVEASEQPSTIVEEPMPHESKPIHPSLPAKPAFGNSSKQRTRPQHPKSSVPSVPLQKSQKSAQSSPETTKEEPVASEEKPEAISEHDSSIATAENSTKATHDVPNGGPAAHSRTARGMRLGGPSTRGHRHVKSGAASPAGLVKEMHHQRTQSSPPSVLRRDRPIITVDAISRLTRTIVASNSDAH